MSGPKSDHPASDGDGVRFVILGAPRTGTNLLCTLLDSHPDVLCHHEVFNPDGIYWALGHRDGTVDRGSIVERDVDPLGFLDRMWSNDLNHRFVGFKMTSGQAQEVLRSVVADAGVRKISVRRRNRLKTYLSMKVAEATQQWEVYDAQSLLPRPKVRLDAEELEANVRANAAFYDDIIGAMRRSGQQWLEVTYDELLDHTTHQRLARFLGFSYPPVLVAASVKQNPLDAHALLDDVAAASAALAHTPWAAELGDVGLT